MCYTHYACAYAPFIAERGCPSFKTRKVALWDRETFIHRSPPVIRYCEEGKRRADAGLPGCPWTSESSNTDDEMVCPLKCPACWDAFIDRLRLSPAETEMIWNKLCKENRNGRKTEEELRILLGWITAYFRDSIVNQCISDKAAFEERWDAALLRDGEALKAGERIAAEIYMGEHEGGLDYGRYESQKEGLLDAYRR